MVAGKNAARRIETGLVYEKTCFGRFDREPRTSSPRTVIPVPTRTCRSTNLVDRFDLAVLDSRNLNAKSSDRARRRTGLEDNCTQPRDTS